jgi:hypothetical protein
LSAGLAADLAGVRLAALAGALTLTNFIGDEVRDLAADLEVVFAAVFAAVFVGVLAVLEAG